VSPIGHAGRVWAWQVRSLFLAARDCWKMSTPTSLALIVTDAPELGAALINVLQDCSVVATVTDGQVTSEHLAHESLDLVFVDLDLQSIDPMDFLRRTQPLIRSRQFVLLASEGSMARVTEAGELGFGWYLRTPVGPAEMSAAIQKARVSEMNRRSETAHVVGSSPGIQSALKLALQIAPRGGHLTINGEPGVGKRLLAQLIHENSPRAGRPFRHFSCEGLSERIVDGELFGRDAGSDEDAGALEGLLKQCHRGTLLLDEISKLPVRSQERLLKCLTLKNVGPVGGRGSASSCDVRIIAASSVELEDAVRSGAFVRELYDRISGVQVVLAPLRERKSDIPVLADHFGRRAPRYGRQPLKGIAPDGLDRLLRHAWPGNVRELEDMIRQSALVAEGPWLSAEDLPALPEAIVGPVRMIPGSTIQEVEKDAILRTLDAAAGSTSRAAKILNMSVRKIQYKLKEYRRESASALRSETVHSVSPQPAPASEARVRAKNAVFVAKGRSPE
jgi:DNA-binding NtrC family response regulator